MVVGSEGFGISGQLRRRLDQVVRIPMRGKVASLNAAVAGSVLLFAAAEQRGDAAVATPPEASAPAPEVVEPAPEVTQASDGPAAEAAEAQTAQPEPAELLPDDTPAD